MLGLSQHTLHFFFHFTLSFHAWVQSANIVIFSFYYTFFPCLGSVSKHCLFSFILHFLSFLRFSQQTLPFFFHFTLSFLAWVQSGNIAFFLSFYTFFPCLGSVSKHCNFFLLLHFLSLLGFSQQTLHFFLLLHFLSLLWISQQTLPFFFHFTLSFLA